MKRNEKDQDAVRNHFLFSRMKYLKDIIAAELEILCISETHMIFDNRSGAVSWGEKVSPRLHQNCMNPENIYTHIHWKLSGMIKHGFRSLWDEKVDNRGKVTGNSRLNLN